MRRHVRIRLALAVVLLIIFVLRSKAQILGAGCEGSNAGSGQTVVSCTANVGTNHLMVIAAYTDNGISGITETLTDSFGLSVEKDNTGCPFNGACPNNVAIKAGFRSNLDQMTIFYVQTGSNSGNDTFTLTMSHECPNWLAIVVREFTIVQPVVAAVGGGAVSVGGDDWKTGDVSFSYLPALIVSQAMGATGHTFTTGTGFTTEYANGAELFESMLPGSSGTYHGLAHCPGSNCSGGVDGMTIAIFAPTSSTIPGTKPAIFIK